MIFAVAMLFSTQQIPSAFAKDSPTFFTCEIKDGLVVGGQEKVIVPLGTAYAFRYATNNFGQSGPGGLIFRMYSGGALVWTQTIPVSVNGTFTRQVPAPVFTKLSGNYGPFYLCATEQLVSGAVEPKAPCSKWHWIPIEVPIAFVSNGCGGMTGVHFVDSTETKLLDKRTFAGVVVSFKEACDIHDAAYSGVVVKDVFLKNTVVNYKQWPRTLVDSQFRTELQQAYAKYLTPSARTNPHVAAAISECLKWATRYYTAVRLVGGLFYDANPVLRGIQGLYVGNPNLGLPYGYGVKRDIR
jgi:hypothetical protein